MMNTIGISSPDSFFAAAMQQPQQLEQLGNDALKSGIDLYMRKDYKGAVSAFQRSLGLSQGSGYAVDAANYMAQAYLAMDDTEGAIKAYKTGIRLDSSRDDSHINLGNLYFSNERYAEAAAEYEKAVNLNPSATNRFSLGEAYMHTGRYGDAETQFNAVKRMQPQKPDGSYGLGLNLAKQGRYDEAILQFEQALNKDGKFYDAYAEIGYAYADMGQMDDAQRQVDLLQQLNPDLADSLSSYMYKVEAPKFSFVYSTDFGYSMPMKTSVAVLDAYLQTPDASKTFTMKFAFNKPMDRESVENPLNWQIRRSAATGPVAAYNFGFPVADTEIRVPLFPKMVIYDAESTTATVYFDISQNTAGDGTIDPSHIEFKFSGKDVYGKVMDPGGDQFSGFSGVA